MRILIVEDDIATRDFMARQLARDGHDVVEADDGRDAVLAAIDSHFDAIVIDRMLPGLDGLSAVKMMRAQGCTAPVLMLTSMGSIADRVGGLKGGADDYLVKPFDFAELDARIHALGRRSARIEPMRLRVADIEIDLERRRVTRGGKRVSLQPREFLLLAELMRNPGRVMTRPMLLERVWDFDFAPQTNLVETHMSRLRTKLNAGFEDDAIQTIRGVGYVMRDDR